MPRTRSLAWSQLKIGLLSLLAVVLAAIFIWFVGGQAGFFWQQYHLKTRFADIQGLQTGAAVRVAGVSVGSVDDIRFVGSDVEVTLRLRDDMQDKITSDSRASIGALSLLGASIIDISPSRTGRPLKDWDYIQSRRPYGQLADVADGATRGLEQATALMRDLRSGKGTVGKLFTDDALYKDISLFVSSAERVVTALNSGNGTLARLINQPDIHDTLESTLENLRVITTRLNAGEGSLGVLLNDPSFSKSLTTTTKNLEDITGKMTRGEGSLGKLVSEETLYNRINSLSERLDQLTKALNEGEGTAGRLLKDKQLYENMNTAVTELRGLVADIRKDPKKYLNVRVSIF